MKKYLALAAAGAVALSVLAAGVAPSQAAKWHQQQNGNVWKKKFQGPPQGGQGQQFFNGPQYKMHSGPPKWVNNGPPKNWSKNNWPSNNWPKNNWPKKQPHYYNNNNNIAPFFFGLALGAIATPYFYD